MPDYIVSDLRCIGSTVNAIELQWKPPADVIAAIKYKIHYRPAGSNSKATIIDVGGESQQCTVTQLRSATKYEIEVAVSTMLGVVSKDSAKIECSTVEDVPTCAPTNVKGEFSGDSYVHKAGSGFTVTASISWTAPPKSAIQGTLLGYKVHYRVESPAAVWEVQDVANPAATSCEVTGLAGDTGYFVAVSCYTGGGEGPRSTQITLKTAEKNKSRFQLRRGNDTKSTPQTSKSSKATVPADHAAQTPELTGRQMQLKDKPQRLRNGSSMLSMMGAPISVTAAASDIAGHTGGDSPLSDFKEEQQIADRPRGSATPSARERQRDEERRQMDLWEAKKVGANSDTSPVSTVTHAKSPCFEDEDGLPTRGLSTRDGSANTGSGLAAARAAKATIVENAEQGVAETIDVNQQSLSDNDTVVSKRMQAAATEPLTNFDAPDADNKRGEEKPAATEWEPKMATNSSSQPPHSQNSAPSASPSLLDVLSGIELNKVGPIDTPTPSMTTKIEQSVGPSESANIEAGSSTNAEALREAEIAKANEWEKKVGTLSRGLERNASSRRTSLVGDLTFEQAEARRLAEMKQMERWENKVGAGGKVHDLMLGADPDPLPKPSRHKLKDDSSGAQKIDFSEQPRRPRANTFGTMRGLSSDSTELPPSGNMYRSQSIADAAGFQAPAPTTGPVQTAMVEFMDAANLEEMLIAFDRVCTLANVERTGHEGLDFFNAFKAKVASQLDFKRGHLLRVITKKVKKFWAIPNVHSCEKLKVVIVGAGPVGLRAAVEMALLGADVTVIEMRTSFTRFNILHLWDWVCADLYDLGCSGSEILGKSFFHVGTKQLQLLLAKVALCFGVKIFSGVKFTGTTPSAAAGERWRIMVDIDKSGHSMNCPKEIPADVLLDAGGAAGPVGKHFNFERKKSKMSTALGLVAHFEVTASDRQMEEFSVSAQFKQSIFKRLRDAGLGLENVVYYQGETHYYVMTPQPSALKAFGVIKKVGSVPSDTVKADNINREKLHDFARQVATFFDLPKSSKFIESWNSAQLFDFSSRSTCKVPMKVVGDDKKGQLVVHVLGDSLIEPFWPEGLGVNRGFLSVLDAAYNIQEYCHAGGVFSKQVVKKMVSSREKAFNIQRVLSAHTKKETMRDDFRSYNLTPMSRYLKWKTGY